MNARYVRWLLPVLLLAAFRPQAPAQTQTTGDTVVLSDTVRWTWEATAGEEKHFSFSVATSGCYRICWGDNSTDDYRIRYIGAGREGTHQYQKDGNYEVKMFGLAPFAAVDTNIIVDTAFGISMELVYVEGGTFSMGATLEQVPEAYDFEKPVHEVTLDGFFIGRFEVSQEQWRAVMGTMVEEQRVKANLPDLYGEGDDYPMYYVSWEEAVEFCEKLSARTGRKYRLPTEAEWEYAARGGQWADGTKYAGGSTIGNVAWYYNNSGGKTHPVGQKQPNGLGLYDMSGNVDEWCLDWAGSYSISSDTNPQGPSTGSERVARGGGWDNAASGCRVSIRYGGLPDFRYFNLGFRVAVHL